MVKTKSVTSLKKPSLHRTFYIFLSVAAVLICIIYSSQLHWLGDDIFIGFRYVQNFLAGDGLVYNVGERVEGYTDFLWIILISFFSRLGGTPETITQILGVFSSAVILILFSIIGYRISNNKTIFIFPFISLALAFNHDFNIWSTSGLEVSFFSMLLASAFFTFFFTTFIEKTRLILSGLFICLAMMTRPDGIIILACVNTCLLFYCQINKTSLRGLILKILFLNLAILIIFVPYFIWRYNYYGFVFPNTYYDKMGNETLFSKGFYYLWLYFKPHFTSLLIFILPIFIVIPFFKNNGKANFKTFISDRTNAAFMTSVIVVYAYLIGFVAKVGGDFMHARFVIPMVPYFYFIIFYASIRLFSHDKKRHLILLSIFLFVGILETYIRLQMFKASDESGNVFLVLDGDVADERLVSLPDVKESRKMGLAMKHAFEGIPIKMLVRGSQACLAYYSNFSYLQEYHGLTDTLIAHSVLPERGRIGHEKSGTLEYFENNGIHFNFDRNPLGGEAFRYSVLKIPPFQIITEIITFQNETMNLLSKKLGADFQFVDFRTYLDGYIRDSIPVKSYDKLKSDFEKFSLYYFKHNTDTAREQHFLTALNK